MWSSSKYSLLDLNTYIPLSLQCLETLLEIIVCLFCTVVALLWIPSSSLMFNVRPDHGDFCNFRNMRNPYGDNLGGNDWYSKTGICFFSQKLLYWKCMGRCIAIVENPLVQPKIWSLPISAVIFLYNLGHTVFMFRSLVRIGCSFSYHSPIFQTVNNNFSPFQSVFYILISSWSCWVSLFFIFNIFHALFELHKPHSSLSINLL